MKRILYVFAVLIAASFTAEAQQRVTVGNIDKPDTYLRKQGSAAPVVAMPQVPLVDGSRALPLNILVDTTLQLAFSARIHPDLPMSEDTTRTLVSRTFPDSSANIGDMYTGVDLPNYTFNGFSQFVPFNYYAPELVNGEFRLDTVLFYLYPPNEPLTTDVEVWLVAIPQKYTATGYRGYNFDLDGTTGIEYLSDGALLTMTADSVNAHIENNSIRPTILDFTQLELAKRTVDTKKMWGLILVKSDRTNTDQLAMIGVHEWTVPNNQTFGGIVGHTNAGSDSVVSLWKTGYRWSHSSESYPAYANQIWKLNYRMNFYGEWTGDLQVGVEPISKEANSFSLAQNAPNPVNDEAKIEFSVANYSHVTLRVYNALGQEVAELANGSYDRGTFSASFNTKGFPSGSYIYVLNANGQSFTRTMQIAH